MTLARQRDLDSTIRAKHRAAAQDLRSQAVNLLGPPTRHPIGSSSSKVRTTVELHNISHLAADTAAQKVKGTDFSKCVGHVLPGSRYPRYFAIEEGKIKTDSPTQNPSLFLTNENYKGPLPSIPPPPPIPRDEMKKKKKKRNEDALVSYSVHEGKVSVELTTGPLVDELQGAIAKLRPTSPLVEKHVSGLSGPGALIQTAMERRRAQMGLDSISLYSPGSVMSVPERSEEEWAAEDDGFGAAKKS